MVLKKKSSLNKIVDIKDKKTWMKLKNLWMKNEKKKKKTLNEVKRNERNIIMCVVYIQVGAIEKNIRCNNKYNKKKKLPLMS